MDFIDLFAEIFKLDYSIINEYASQGPIYQLFYIVFFPTVFIIFFIYILSRLVIYSHKGIRVMISIAIYAFIVLQGYYKWFVYFSRFWLFGLLLIGILYMIITRGHEPKPQGGVKAKTVGGTGSLVKLFEKTSGKKLNPLENIELAALLDRLIKYINAEIKALNEQIKQAEPQERNFLQAEVGKKEAVLAQLTMFKRKGNLADFAQWLKTEEGKKYVATIL